MIERRGTDRRHARTRFRFPERRTGFDRRASDGRIAWYRDRPHIVPLNIDDAHQTTQGSKFGTVFGLDPNR